MKSNYEENEESTLDDYDYSGPLNTPKNILKDPEDSNTSESSPDILPNLHSSTDNQTDILFDPSEWLISDPSTGRRRPPHQFEFLLQLLNNPRYKTYVHWIDKEQGLCKILLPDHVVQLWGKVKSRQTTGKMTYQTFSRGLRCYYKKNLLIKTRKKYTFRFNQVKNQILA